MKQNRKYLAFEARVAYSPKDDMLHLTSGDPELAAAGWRLVLTKHTPAEIQLRRMLEHAGMLRFSATELPEIAHYPAVDPYPWYQFPIGIDTNGKTKTLDLTENPHILLAGSTGSGKTVLLNTLLTHVAHTLPNWQVYVVDQLRVEYNRHRQIPLFNEHLSVAGDLEDAARMLRNLHALMMDRYAMLESRGERSVAPLIEKGYLRAALVILDEAYITLSPEGSKSEEGRYRDQLHAEMLELITSISRLGRAAGIHLVIATQRPDAAVIPGALRSNLENRILLRGSPTAQAMVLDYQLDAEILQPRGRAALNLAGERDVIQTFLTRPADIVQALRG